jgi:hypothetical protein
LYRLDRFTVPVEMVALYWYQWRLSRWNSWSIRAGASMAFQVGTGVRVPAGGVGVSVGPGVLVGPPPEQPETASIASISRINGMLPDFVLRLIHLVLRHARIAGVVRMMPVL